MKSEGKSFWKSRTLWFNLATILLGVVEVVNGVYPIPPDLLVLFVAGGNFLIRFVTSKPLSL